MYIDKHVGYKFTNSEEILNWAIYKVHVEFNQNIFAHLHVRDIFF